MTGTIWIGLSIQPVCMSSAMSARSEVIVAFARLMASLQSWASGGHDHVIAENGRVEKAYSAMMLTSD